MDQLIITCLITAILTAFITWQIARRFAADHHATTSALNFQTKKNDLIDSTKTSIVDSPDFLARLNNEYLRGRDDGRKEELEKFSIIYEPFQDVAEEFMGIKKRAELGYSVQLYYAGLPIGEATRKTTHTNIKFDEERIDKLMNSELIGSLNGICQLLLTKGIGSKVLPLKR